MKATYARLPDRSWGIRVHGVAVPGLKITIHTRDGRERAAVVDRVLWAGTAKDGCVASLVTLVGTAHWGTKEYKPRPNREPCGASGCDGVDYCDACAEK